MRIHYQNAEAHVCRPLIPVRKLTQNEYTLHLDTTNPHIEKATPQLERCFLASSTTRPTARATRHISSTVAHSLEHLLTKDYLEAKTDTNYKRHAQT